VFRFGMHANPLGPFFTDFRAFPKSQLVMLNVVFDELRFWLA